jgi:hypothetical protein
LPLSLYSFHQLGDPTLVFGQSGSHDHTTGEGDDETTVTHTLLVAVTVLPRIITRSLSRGVCLIFSRLLLAAQQWERFKMLRPYPTTNATPSLFRTRKAKSMRCTLRFTCAHSHSPPIAGSRPAGAAATALRPRCRGKQGQPSKQPREHLSHRRPPRLPEPSRALN